MYMPPIPLVPPSPVPAVVGATSFAMRSHHSIIPRPRVSLKVQLFNVFDKRKGLMGPKSVGRSIILSVGWGRWEGIDHHHRNKDGNFFYTWKINWKESSIQVTGWLGRKANGGLFKLLHNGGQFFDVIVVDVRDFV